MEFRVLGPLEARGRDGPLTLGGSKQKAVLALLLLSDGRPLAVDRIADKLWGESPPATARKTVQVYVSHLRRALGDGHIQTGESGYALELGDAMFDLHEFQELTAAARSAREAGDARRAADVLRRALSLWRGEPLADLSYEPWAEPHVRHLEELRVRALEDRIDADLELDRHAELVPELQSLIRANPWRERLRAQLMLALYRSGRQADALDAYRQARQELRDELGLEPGAELRELETAILRHDETLASAHRRRLRVGRDARRGRALLVAGGALTALAAVAAGVVALTGGARIARVAANSVAVIDPGSGRVKADIAVGDDPAGVAIGRDAVWVASSGNSTIARVDPKRFGVVSTVGAPHAPGALVATGDALWLTSAISGALVHVDQTSGAVVGSIHLRRPEDLFAPLTRGAIAASDRALWVNAGRSRIEEVDAASGRVLRTVALGVRRSVDAIALGFGSVWVASSDDDSVERIDATDGRVRAQISIAAAGRRVAGPAALAVGNGAVWVADTLGGRVSKIDPRLNAVAATVRVGRSPTAISAGAGAVWVANSGDNTISKIDPRAAAVRRTITLRAHVTALVAGDGAVWAAADGSPAPTGAVPAGHQAVALPTPPCSPIEYRGPGKPQYLIVSDLPLHWGAPGDNETSREMHAAAAATRLAIARTGFRAGRFRVGFQSCDDSTASARNWTPERCRQNAELYAADPSVLGVVGPTHSDCAKIEIAPLNRALAGPVPIIGPTTTYIGLTRAGAATVASEPERYYPTGARNFLRVTATDEAQGVAAILLARQLRERPIFLVDDGETYGFGLAAYARRAAQHLRVPVAGSGTWNPDAHSYVRLARRIKASHAGVVLLAGCGCFNGGQLLRDLRAALGPRVTLIAPDGWSPFGAIFRDAGRAANGLYLSTPGFVSDALGAAARPFLAVAKLPRSALSAGSSSATEEANGAAAAQALLQAIAHSNGTRLSVLRQLRARPARGTAIGDFAFTPSGDVRPATVSFLRIRDGRVVFERVISPPPSLIGLR